MAVDPPAGTRFRTEENGEMSQLVAWAMPTFDTMLTFAREKLGDIAVGMFMWVMMYYACRIAIRAGTADPRAVIQAQLELAWAQALKDEAAETKEVTGNG